MHLAHGHKKQQELSPLSRSILLLSCWNKCHHSRLFLITFFLWKPNFTVKNVILELVVHCPFGFIVKSTSGGVNRYVLATDSNPIKDGCKAKMPMKELESHIQKCPYNQRQIHESTNWKKREAELLDEIRTLKRICTANENHSKDLMKYSIDQQDRNDSQSPFLCYILSHQPMWQS